MTSNPDHLPGANRKGAVGGPVVAVLGTRYPDLRIEEGILRPLGASLRRGDGQDMAAIVEVAGDAEVIMAGSRPRLDRQTLEALPSCKGIVRYGVGTETIDLAAAARLGIKVARVSDYGTEAVSFHAVALALAAMRRLTAADRGVREGGWGFAHLRPLHLPSATTAGVVGYGRIGRATAGLLAGLGFDVIAYDAYVPVPEDGRVRPAGSLERLLADADLVSLHVPGGDAPILDRERLSLLREGSILVNTARGRLVDTDALIEGMAAGRPAVAALDVFDTEPPDLGRFAPVADRLIATPHMAWYTEESERDLRTKAAEEAARMLRGEPLRDPVSAGPDQVRS